MNGLLRTLKKKSDSRKNNLYKTEKKVAKLPLLLRGKELTCKDFGASWEQITCILLRHCLACRNREFTNSFYEAT